MLAISTFQKCLLTGDFCSNCNQLLQSVDLLVARTAVINTMTGTCSTTYKLHIAECCQGSSQGSSVVLMLIEQKHYYIFLCHYLPVLVCWMALITLILQTVSAVTSPAWYILSNLNGADIFLHYIAGFDHRSLKNSLKMHFRLLKLTI